MKLGLGTAQFGLDYGITNRTGKVAEAEVAPLLLQAAAAGMTILDTAAAYGDAEDMLGKYLEAGHHFGIVTKVTTKVCDLGLQGGLNVVEQRFKQSLHRLCTHRVYGLLVHNTAELMGDQGDALAKWLLQKKTDAVVEHVGASVYSPQEAQNIYERYPFDLIQLPLNVLDQRMLDDRLLEWLGQRQVEIHVRSAFLQGVLLISPDALPRSVVGLQSILDNFHKWCMDREISPLQAALGFIRSACPSATVICGVGSRAELAQIIAAARAPWGNTLEFAPFRSNDNPLIDPRRWN